jgi:hypothetical protein
LIKQRLPPSRQQGRSDLSRQTKTFEGHRRMRGLPTAR